jgi:hypothetical protein
MLPLPRGHSARDNFAEHAKMPAFGWINLTDADRRAVSDRVRGYIKITICSRQFSPFSSKMEIHAESCVPGAILRAISGGHMTRRRHLSIGTACWFLLVVAALSAQSLSAQAVQVVDAEGHSTTLTAAQIANLPHVTIEAHDHEGDARFGGVPLSALLPAAGVALGDALRGPRMAEVLLVSAADGYKVAFALAEIDPAFATRQIILADKRDTKLLNAKEGPFRIVAPGDKRPARWIRQVTELRIIAVK